MKKILIALPNDTLGGAEQYLKLLCEFFVREGFEVDVLFLKRRKADGWAELELNYEVSLYYTKSSTEKYGLAGFLYNLWRLRKSEYEYIFTSHVHMTGILGVFCRLGVLKKKYFVGRESTLIFSRFKGFKLMIFKLQYFLGYPALDLLICQTETMFRHFHEFLPRLSKKIRLSVIPNPISWEQLYSEVDMPISFYHDFATIVTAGRLIQEKGFDILIRAFKDLLEDYPNCRLMIFGEGKDRRNLLEIISRFNLENRVMLMGFERNILPYFQAADLCVVSSLIEGFPNVLLQMMAKNVNVVSTLCAGGIEHIPGLYTAATGDVDGLKNALKRCLQVDNRLNRELFDNYLFDKRIENFVLRVEKNLLDGYQS